MPDKYKRLIKFLVLGLIVGVLVIKFALPAPNGPSSIAESELGLLSSPIGVSNSSSSDSYNALEPSVANQDQTEPGNVEAPPTPSQKTNPNFPSNNEALNTSTGEAAKPEDNQKSESSSVTESIPIWLLFRSQTCVPCIEMQKTFDLLKPEFVGRVNFVSFDVNDPANQKLLADFKIRYIPTTYLIDRHQQLYYQQIGVVPVGEMRAKIKALSEVP